MDLKPKTLHRKPQTTDNISLILNTKRFTGVLVLKLSLVLAIFYGASLVPTPETLNSEPDT